jgi:hypothetical protein
MIIPEWLIWGAAILVAAVVTFLLRKRLGKDDNSLRLALVAGVLAGGAVALLILAPAKLIILVEEKEDAPGTYTHKTFNIYGRPNIPTSDGAWIPTDSLDLEGKRHLFNCTDMGMVIYPSAYTSGKEKEFEMPDPIFLNDGEYDRIPTAPSYWFTDAPDSITERENILETIWNSLFGSVTIKWAILPYDPDEDESELDELEDEEDDEDGEIDPD